MRLFNKTIPLFKSKEAATDELPEEQLNAAEAFDEALSSLNKSASEETEEDELKKAKKATKTAVEEPEEEPEEEEESEEEEEEEEEEKPKKKKVGMKKSTSETPSLDSLVRENEEAAAAMDVEPFLKALVDGIDKKISAIQSGIQERIVELSESFDKMVELQKAQSQVLVAEGTLLKSALGVDKETLGKPVARKATLAIERFAKSAANEDAQFTVADAKMKLIELVKSKKLTPHQVAIVEGRLNKNLALPEFFTQMLKSEQA